MANAVDGNFFSLFGLSGQYAIDPEDLAARYRDLQRRVHPDRFAAAPDAERRASVQMTALINEAYQTLRDPVRRAQYMLDLRARDGVVEPGLDAEFLAEQMGAREVLAEVRQLDEPHTKLAELARDTARQVNARMEEFAACVESDVGRARKALREMQFLDKLRREIEEIEGELS